jgi:ribosome-binding protein aMBF1 (putative translation factor)
LVTTYNNLMKLSQYDEKLIDDHEYQEALKALEYQFLFGNAVLRARLAKGWTQKELAKRVGTKQANISRIEGGLGNPTLELIQKICKALEIELRFLNLGTQDLK